MSERNSIQGATGDYERFYFLVAVDSYTEDSHREKNRSRIGSTIHRALHHDLGTIQEDGGSRSRHWVYPVQSKVDLEALKDRCKESLEEVDILEFVNGETYGPFKWGEGNGLDEGGQPVQAAD